MFELNSAAAVKPSRRRPLLCQACEQFPAAFLCKADDASLCAACDSDIHSANPLACRHHRIPIAMDSGSDDDDKLLTDRTVVDEDEATLWLLPGADQKNSHHVVDMLFGGGVVDEYLDLDDYNSNNNSCQFGNQPGRQYFGTATTGIPHKGSGDDSVVPIQDLRGKCLVPDQYEGPNIGYGFTAPVSRNISFSSMDVGIVPEASSPATNEASTAAISQGRALKGTIDLFTGCHVQMMMPSGQLSADDREARVLRYREKKKTRKFEKTIRYASRKAYAEVRPRIKGRFAKRETDGDGGGIVGMVAEPGIGMSKSAAAGGAGGTYGIVPSLF
ncbi:zinc finger protein CONSTANS-like [Andrographis paniculata]|uniref:zinc finger protein CONSTANS-like n=1 Tax=Andrographis paniculata TaxID=175694 RepID=UPI0021E91FC3|nr:zinc finger protein CONSTANS-like [Andrographis paniculata]